MDITGIEPVAYSLRTRRDTTTPYTLSNIIIIKIIINIQKIFNFEITIINICY